MYMEPSTATSGCLARVVAVEWVNDHDSRYAIFIESNEKEVRNVRREDIRADDDQSDSGHGSTLRDLSSAQEPLPPGWEAVKRGARVVFVDHNTETTTFQDPRLHKRLVRGLPKG